MHTRWAIALLVLVALTAGNHDEMSEVENVKDLGSTDMVVVTPKQPATQPTPAQMKAFQQIVGKLADHIVKQAKAGLAYDMTQVTIEDVSMGIAAHELYSHMSKNGALGESAGVGFIGAIASMASKMVGPGMVTKLLTPLLAKIPEPWGKKYGMAAVIKQVVVDLLKKKDPKTTLINAVKSVGKKVAIDPVLKKVPAQFRPLLSGVIDKLMNVPPDIKGAKKALIEGIFKYGVTKVTNVVKSMTQKLPGFAQKPAFDAINGFIKAQVGTLQAKVVAMLGGEELAESNQEQFDIVGLVFGKLADFIKGVIHPLIKNTVAKLPAAIGFAKEPITTGICGIIDATVAEVKKSPTSPDTKAITQIVIKKVVAMGLAIKKASPVGFELDKVEWDEDIRKAKALKESKGRRLLAVESAQKQKKPKRGKKKIGLNSKTLVGLEKQLTQAEQDRFKYGEGKNGLDIEWAGSRKYSTSLSPTTGKKGGHARLGTSQKFFGGGGKSKGKGGGGGGGMSGMIMKFVGPLIDKFVPADFRPLVKEVLPAVVSGNKQKIMAALKKGILKLASSKIVVFLDPYIKKLPADFQPIIKSVLPLLLQGNIQGMIAALKSGIIKYGVKKIGGILDKFVFSKLPSFIGGPAKTAVMGLINKAAAAHTRRELGAAAEIKMAQELGCEDTLPLNLANVLIEKAAGMVEGVLPGLVDKMTAKACVGPLAPAKAPLNAGIKEWITKVMAIVKKGPSMWNEKGKTEIIKITMASAMSMADKLKSIATSALRL